MFGCKACQLCTRPCATWRAIILPARAQNKISAICRFSGTGGAEKFNVIDDGSCSSSDALVIQGLADFLSAGPQASEIPRLDLCFLSEEKPVTAIRNIAPDSASSGQRDVDIFSIDETLNVGKGDCPVLMERR